MSLRPKAGGDTATEIIDLPIYARGVQHGRSIGRPVFYHYLMLCLYKFNRFTRYTYNLFHISCPLSIPTQPLADRIVFILRTFQKNYRYRFIKCVNDLQLVHPMCRLKRVFTCLYGVFFYRINIILKIFTQSNVYHIFDIFDIGHLLSISLCYYTVRAR